MNKVLATLVIFLFFSISSIYIFYLRKMQAVDVTVVGNIKYADGISRQAIDVLKMLDTDEISSNLIRTNKLEKDDLDPIIINKIKKNSQNFLGKTVIYENLLGKNSILHKYRVTIQTFFGSFLSFLRGESHDERVWYSYSMYESTKIPKILVETLNKYFDAVLVPDNFLVAAYKSSGVTKPIFVVPLPVDMDYLLQMPIKSSKNRIFTFMNLSAFYERKNQIGIVKAFNKVFHNNPNVRLIINSRKVYHPVRKLLLKYIKENKINNIEVTEKKLSQQDYLKMLQQADCYINVAQGEGFSIQPREAMALGIPVIISNNTAQKTIADSNLVLSVKSDIPTPSYNAHTKLFSGNHFITRVDDIAYAMQDMYKNYGYYLSKAPLMRQWVRRYHYDNIKHLYRTVAKPKSVIFGKENKITNGTIVTNDKFFYQKMCNTYKLICKNN